MTPHINKKILLVRNLKEFYIFLHYILKLNVFVVVVVVVVVIVVVVIVIVIIVIVIVGIKYNKIK